MLVTDEVANTNMSDETLDVRDISRGPITVSHQPPFFFMRSFATEECMKTILKLFNIIRIGSDAVLFNLYTLTHYSVFISTDICKILSH